jgi:hypothetical protein
LFRKLFKMAPQLPKDYKVAVFESQGAPLTLKQVKLELPKAGEVRRVPADGTAARVFHSPFLIIDPLLMIPFSALGPG